MYRISLGRVINTHPNAMAGKKSELIIALDSARSLGPLFRLMRVGAAALPGGDDKHEVVEWLGR